MKWEVVGRPQAERQFVRAISCDFVDRSCPNGRRERNRKLGHHPHCSPIPPWPEILSLVPSGIGSFPNRKSDLLSKIPFPQSKIPFPQSKIPFPKSKIPFPKSKIRFPKTKISSPKTKIPFPNTKIPSPQAKIASPQSRMAVLQSKIDFLQSGMDFTQSGIRDLDLFLLLQLGPNHREDFKVSPRRRCVRFLMMIWFQDQIAGR